MQHLIAIRTVTIEDRTERTVDARHLHAFLDVGKDFSNWIKARIRQYDFAEGEDYVVFPSSGENPQGGRPGKEYRITLDMAKELAMVERNEKGRQARRYFIDAEKQWRQEKQWHRGRDQDPPAAAVDGGTDSARLADVQERLLRFQAAVRAYEKDQEQLIRLRDTAIASIRNTTMSDQQIAQHLLPDHPGCPRTGFVADCRALCAVQADRPAT